MKMCWKFKKKCKARIHTNENFILSDVTKISHVHFPDIAKIEAKRAMENLKELAKKTELSLFSNCRFRGNIWWDYKGIF